MGARAYTAQQIQPLLTLQMKRQFLPQTVAAYAAGQSFQALRDTFPDFTYKEAALNPTNPNDRASDWEADIIHEFRNNPDRKELVVERDTPTGPMLNLARPLGIYDEGCLVCHGKVEDAPKTMTDIYGVNNGFGWKMGEIIGAQVVTVPMSVPLARAQQTFTTFMILLTGVFVLLLVLLNILLHFVVIRPVTRMSAIASEVSMGKPDVPEYVRHGSDEIASLSQSFNRMRLSLENAMKMLGE
jgi:HAMP domain-containing protein